MMKKKYGIVFLILIILLLWIVYHIPVPKKDFFTCYQKEDFASESLKIFYRKPTKTISIQNINWKYLITGKGKKVILWLHGMAGAYDLWWQQVTEFENDYRVITYTLPGEIDNLNDVWVGIQTILDRENIDSVILAGTSMGGYIAQYLLIKMPQRIETIILGNTFPPNSDILKKNRFKAILVSWLPEIVVYMFAQKQLNNQLLPAANHSKLLGCFLSSLPFSKQNVLNRFQIVVEKFTIDPKQYQNIPKLIIESDNDPLIPPHLREQLKNLYIDAQVYTFSKQGHFPYINASKEYNQVVRKFLENSSISK